MISVSSSFQLFVVNLLFLQQYLAFNLAAPFISPLHQRTNQSSSFLSQLAALHMNPNINDEIETTIMNPKDAKGVIFDIDGMFER